MYRRLMWGAVALTAIVAAWVAFSVLRPGQGSGTGLIVPQTGVADLQMRSSAVTPRISAGLIPPTNKWFSALVFSQAAQPAYAYPLSFKTTGSGYEVDAPQPTASGNAVFATHKPTLAVDVAAAGLGQVTAYDDLSVELTQSGSDGQPTAASRVTQGSPYIFTQLRRTQTVTIKGLGKLTLNDPHQATLTAGTQTFGIWSEAPMNLAADQLTIAGTAGSRFSVFALPSGADQAAYFTAARHPITGTNTSYDVSGTTATTRYQLTASGGPTLFAPAPSTGNVKSAPASAGSFTTLLGTQIVYATGDLTLELPTATPAAQLDLSRVSEADRGKLIASLKTDAANINFSADDTYFGGKQLYRAANLLTLARQLGQDDVATQIQSRLRSELQQWFDPKGGAGRTTKYFYYDSTYHGLIGAKASFGSDAFNDHHFHYGYFIYAAAAVAETDPAFANSAAPMVNLLISDLAASESSNYFPKQRLFDAYNGHSWAAGHGDFNDGNNQESSSEAVNAWAGIYRWSQVAHNARLAEQSRWLYTAESTAATRQWLAPAIPSGYAHPFYSLIWGGKSDYATFFSADPAALLGIQIIPASPAQGYLATAGPEHIKRNLAAAAANPAAYQAPFGDYLIMYQALADPAGARDNLARFPVSSLDSANSMTYLSAWVYTRTY